MRKTVYLNYIIGYFIICIATSLFVYCCVAPNLNKHELDIHATDLYKQASALSNSYSSSHYDIESNEYNYTKDLKQLAYSSDTIIWITNNEGKILYSSNPEYKSKDIKNFSSYFDNRSYVTGNVNNLFEQDYISVIAPIVNTYKTHGYIVISHDLETITNKVNHTVSYVYVSSFLVICTSLILILIFYIRVHRPVNKISEAVKEYSKGNLDYDGPNIKSKDDFGELADYLNVLCDELKNLDERQKKFIANVSHDFRSPLTSIKGYLEAMLDGTIPPELSEKYINIVLTETERLTKLTSSLLTLNEWDVNGASLDIQEFDCVSMIRYTLQSFEGQCIKKKISFDVTFGAKTYSVLADQSKIQQVVYNLIDNAIKFSNPNSKIFVTVTDINEKVFVSIKDTGIGIPKESIKKIWDRFYKSDLSRGKDKAGTGLGLSIVKEIITSHNENINVVSTEGVGTEFTFSLTKTKKSLLI